MSRYTPIAKDPYYRKTTQAVPVGGGTVKPTIHFYPDITDEILNSKKYDIPMILTYADTQKAIMELEDDIHTVQMIFANNQTAIHYDCFIHYLDTKTDTQKIAHVIFNPNGTSMVKEWV